MSKTATIQNVKVAIFEEGNEVEIYPARWRNPIATGATEKEAIAAAEAYILENPSQFDIYPGERIQALKDEAIEAGDYAQAALCDRAMSGDEDAVEACLKALEAGSANE